MTNDNDEFESKFEYSKFETMFKIPIFQIPNVFGTLEFRIWNLFRISNATLRGVRFASNGFRI